MDEADLADEAIERHLALALREVRGARVLAPIGMCHSCAEPLTAPRRWCDAGCRDDWERATEAARRNIRVTDEL